MKLHPLHPISVHAPIACLLFVPLRLSPRDQRRGVFGLIAAALGAIDFERAYAKAPKTVSWHAALMATAITLDGASAEMSRKPVGTIQAARDAYERSAWADATELFLSADAESALEIEDLEALVWAAGISAQDRVMLATLERLYAHHLPTRITKNAHARHSGAGFGTC